MSRIVIAGGGQAAGWAIKTLRDGGFIGSIALVAEEAHPPYERPPLSKAVLAGHAPPEQTHLFKDGLLARLGIDWHRERRATAIDRKRRSVTLDDGTCLPFDRLLVATGGRARTLAMGTAPIHTLRGLDDALALRERMRTARSLLVIGGGWIGLEVASTAHAAGLRVHVVEAAPRPCARVLPAGIGARLQTLHERHGVTFSLGTTLGDIAAADGGVQATLSNGTARAADLAVAGLGMVANDELASAAGLDCEDGILVDARCATSDPAIFAAGDVARVRTRWSETPLRLESWQNAQDQGIAAARAMLGHEVRYDPVPRFWSEQHGVHLQIVGLPAAGDTFVVRGDLERGPGIAFVLRDDVARAAIGFNAGRDMRPARNLVERGVRIDAARLADPTVSLVDAASART